MVPETAILMLDKPFQRGPILTLEPLLESVRRGIEEAGWILSGLQKTTSREFEGRWAGDHTRSAYLFFHRDDLPEAVCIEGFLDETSRGLRGTLSLVIDGPPLSEVRSAARVLRRVGRGARDTLPSEYRTPVVVRLAMDDADGHPAEASVQVRVKLAFPTVAMEAGASAVSALSAASVSAFEDLLECPEIAELLPPVMD